MRHASTLLVFAALLASCASPAAAQVPAFPGAEGAGAFSLGGRGGRVLRVTNLEDSGPGSLRAAVEASGPRIVVFDIGGTIRLRKPLAVRHGRITIAGQTAPGGGITLRDYTLGIAADDVVVRFIRSRLGDESRVTGDAVWVTGGTRIILDHLSTSWGTDEVLSVTSNTRRPGGQLGDITVQWSIIAESLCNSVNPDGRHCYGSIIAGSRGSRVSLHHNLWAHHAARMPRLGNSLGPQQDRIGAFFEIRSNVFYNWGGHQAGYDGAADGRMTSIFADNSYLRGPDSRGADMFKAASPHAEARFAGNNMDGRPFGDNAGGRLGPGRRPEGFRRSPAEVQGDPAPRAYQRVMREAGASLYRDPVDARIVADVRTRSGRLIDSQRDVGGWPELAPGKPWRDRDGDGMPDQWEWSRGLNPNNPRDGSRDKDGDGYTNVEEWLNSLVSTD